ncbi:MAG: hypothetical protein WC975_06915 [Phycisphaerae bacterium]
MSITPVNIGRVSQNMQMSLLLQGSQRTMVSLLRSQEQLSTGLRILRPSDDPIGASAAIRMEETLAAQQQQLDNMDHAGKVMDTANSTMMSIRQNLLNQAQTLALDNVDSGATAEQRQSASVLVESIIQQMVSMGNTEYLGSYIFGGRQNTSTPFQEYENGVRFTGDLQSITEQVAPDTSVDISLGADEVFGTGSGKISGYSDLAPSANSNTRLTDITGALGQGIRPGTFSIVGSVIGQVNVDINGAATIGDVIGKINAALPASVQAALTADGRHIQISSTNAGETAQVLETGQGTTAHDLGLYTPVAQGSPVTSSDIGPKLLLQTDINALNGGAGIDLAHGIIITNGQNTINLTFDTATTVQDILNAINTSGVGVKAQLNADQTGIEIVNQIAGSRLTIGENGGSTADDLGIRTLRGETLLSGLNEGLGVHSAGAGENDFQINTADGSTISVNISGAKTFQDVIDKINTAANANGTALTASLATTGNGLVLTDNTVGANQLTVVRDPSSNSNAAQELGILKSASSGSNQIVGTDVNPTKEESIFTYLLDLRDSLASNDQIGIQTAGENIQKFMDGPFSKALGKISYMSKGLQTRQTQTENAVVSTTALVSGIKDLDYTEAITKFQNLQTALQANLQAGSQILQTSLLDYLQ